MTCKRCLGVFLLFLALDGAGYADTGRKFKPKLSLKLTGGAGFAFIGDINKSQRTISNNQRFASAKEWDPSLVVGGLKPIASLGGDWEAELRLDITPRISLGIATSGAVKRYTSSSITYTYKGDFGHQITTFISRPKIEASMPVRLSCFYTKPLGPKMNLALGGGIGWYSGKAARFLRIEVILPSGGFEWTNSDFNTRQKSTLGFHGQAALEYRIRNNVSLITEIQARLVRIRNLRGRGRYWNVFGFDKEFQGTLYYFTEFDEGIGAGYANLEIHGNPKFGVGRWIDNIRKAVLDLSGISLRLGIRIRIL